VYVKNYFYPTNGALRISFVVNVTAKSKYIKSLPQLQI